MARARKSKETGGLTDDTTATAVVEPEEPAESAANSSDGVKEKSTAAYWKRILHEHPEWVEEAGSNAKLAQLWLSDHPGHTEMPKKIRQNLANIKSMIRRERREEQQAKASARRKEQKAAAGAGQRPPNVSQAYEALEIKIDKCMAQAWALD
jgi:hypothetical protein